MTNMTQNAFGFDPEMNLIAPATNVIKALSQLMKGELPTSTVAVDTTKNDAAKAKLLQIEEDEAFARMLQAEDDADFARALQAIEEQEANDAAIAQLLQADEDEAFSRMLQEQEDADFAFALSLQFEEANMMGSSASYEGLGALGQDY